MKALSLGNEAGQWVDTPMMKITLNCDGRHRNAKPIGLK